MASPITAPATLPDEGSELAAFWQELREVNSAIASLNDQAREIERRRIRWRAIVDDLSTVEDAIRTSIVLLKVQSDAVDASTRELEDQRGYLRTCINKRVRPTLRPLNILDLPDELLMQIFKHVKGGSDKRSLYFFNFDPSEVKEVKVLRLVCRRFRDTSSHLLLRFITVNMTMQSLAHLEEVSHQPIISKGIRAIQVVLSFYDSVLAGDLRDFATYQASRLRSAILSWQSSVDSQDLLSKPSEKLKTFYRTAIARALPIAESWEEVAANNIREDCVNYKLLQRAHEQYKQCYKDTATLRQGMFVQTIASAMAKMPTATWLQIYDDDPQGSSVEGKNIFPRDVNNHELLLHKLLFPMTSWEEARVHGLGNPPAELIPGLLLAMHEKGVQLTGLKIWTPLPENLSLLLPDGNQLEAAVKHLRVVSFLPQRMSYKGHFWVVRPADEWRPFQKFMSILLSSTSLQHIDLGFEFLYTRNLASRLSMGSVVSPHSWPKLKSLSFTGPFHFSELERVVRRAAKGLRLDWTGHLMGGSWVEVLDLMRESVFSGDLEFGSGVEFANVEVSGQECTQMTEVEADRIFCGHYATIARECLATSYIGGFRESNPVSDWARGDLVLRN